MSASYLRSARVDTPPSRGTQGYKVPYSTEYRGLVHKFAPPAPPRPPKCLKCGTANSVINQLGLREDLIGRWLQIVSY